MYAVEQERDYLLNERLGLTAQVELFQRDLKRCRTEANLARTEADIARLEVHTSRAEVTDMRYRVGGLRHDLEFAEEQGNEARLEISELKTQNKTLEETISELRHQVKTRDSRITRGMKYLSKSYEELDAGVYMHEIPITPPSESSVH